MNRVVTLIALLSCFTSLSAQWDFGVYAGISRTQLKGDAPKNFTYRASYQPTFGAVINYHIKDDARLSFQPGYAINTPVLAYRDRDLDEKRDSIALNLNYLRLPVFLDIISDNGKWHFVGGVDVQVGFDQQGEAIGGDQTFDLNDELRNINPVVIFGLGRRIALGRSLLNVDLRFGQSILNASDVRDDETSLVPRIKTSTLELLVSYEFSTHRNSNL